MKHLLLVAFFFCGVSFAAEPQTGEIVLPKVLRVGLETFRDVTYLSHDAAFVKFSHADGLGRAPISGLPRSLQTQLGYNAEAAEAAQSADRAARGAADAAAARAAEEGRQANLAVYKDAAATIAGMEANRTDAALRPSLEIVHAGNGKQSSTTVDPIRIERTEMDTQRACQVIVRSSSYGGGKGTVRIYFVGADIGNANKLVFYGFAEAPVELAPRGTQRVGATAEAHSKSTDYTLIRVVDFEGVVPIGIAAEFVQEGQRRSFTSNRPRLTEAMLDSMLAER